MWGAIAAAAAPFVTGLLSAGGEVYSAQQNREEAQRNRDWQERMSNTAVQRAVKDYAAAGLNPALAYDRSASSPSGAQATIGNPISSGISNALAVRQQQQAARQAAPLIEKAEQEAKGAKVTAEHTEELLRSQIQSNMGTAAAGKAAAEVSAANEKLLLQTLKFNNDVQQPHTQRMNALDAQLRALGIPKAENDAEYERQFRKLLNGVHNAKDAREVTEFILRRLMK